MKRGTRGAPALAQRKSTIMTKRGSLPSTTPTVRRLRPTDGALLALLAKEDADFDLAGRGGGLRPLHPKSARAFLTHPSVHFWVALHQQTISGFLFCLQLPLRTKEKHEILLYEIGVRRAFRRRGIGRALLAELDDWMQRDRIAAAWVCADNPIAEKFYRACGFHLEGAPPVYLVRNR
jgi:ribosomal protein S18 acetylase RimI-like enzyme